MEVLDMKELDQVVGGATAIELIDLVDRLNRYLRTQESLREPPLLTFGQ